MAKKGANGYKLPDPIPEGAIFLDIAKKRWKIGPSIGQGGFGEIYSAQEVGGPTSKYPFVIKVEPHSNGPLFVEINFYIRNAKTVDVEEFQKWKKLKTFGMPIYLGSGSHEYKGQKYRFLVLQKFGTDIWKLFLQNKRIFAPATVFKLGIQMLDVLEYIHQCGYIHADIKGANILLGDTKETQDQAYLLDYGLACRYTTEVEYKPNPKKAHDGTIEYLSRDAHDGVQTRRGDLEILGYNMIQWLGCTLPWEKLKTPVAVQESKKKHMENIPEFLKTCFGDKPIPTAVEEYLKYVNNMRFNGQPEYPKIRNILLSGIEKAGLTFDSPFIFKDKSSLPMKRKSTPVKKVPKRALAKNKRAKTTEADTVDEPETSKARKTKKDTKEVGAKAGATRGRPKKDKEGDPSSTKSGTFENFTDEMKAMASGGPPDDFSNYNDEMKEIAMKKNGTNVPKNGEFDGYTPEMRALAMKLNKNKKTKAKKTTKDAETVPKPANDRPRRNVRPVQYLEV